MSTLTFALLPVKALCNFAPAYSQIDNCRLDACAWVITCPGFFISESADSPPNFQLPRRKMICGKIKTIFHRITDNQWFAKSQIHKPPAIVYKKKISSA